MILFMVASPLFDILFDNQKTLWQCKFFRIYTNCDNVAILLRFVNPARSPHSGWVKLIDQKQKTASHRKPKAVFAKRLCTPPPPPLRRAGFPKEGQDPRWFVVKHTDVTTLVLLDGHGTHPTWYANLLLPKADNALSSRSVDSSCHDVLMHPLGLLLETDFVLVHGRKHEPDESTNRRNKEHYGQNLESFWDFPPLCTTHVAHFEPR